MSPDILLLNGTIHTLDPHQPLANALLLRDHQIAAVGDVAAVRALAKPGYELVDLQGRSAIPGLCDAHIHLLWTARVADQVDLDQVPSLDAALDRIRHHAASLPADAWVLGHGWDHSLWGDTWPTATALDAVTGGRPAFFTRKDLHSAWANSAALARAGIDAATPDLPDGTIGRDPSGAPSGMLFETAQNLITELIPPPTAAANERAIAALNQRLLARGITSIHAPEGPDCLAAVGALYARGELRVRVLHHIRQPWFEHAVALGLRSGIGDHWLRIGGLKLFSDGSLGSMTAHMLAPYVGLDPADPASLGMPMFSAAELTSHVTHAIANGFSVTIHAIGDAANRASLDAIQYALDAAAEPVPSGTPRLRNADPAHAALIPNRIEHAQILDPADFRRFAELGIVASIQPIHAMSDMEVAERLWGDRTRYAYAWRSLLEAGATLACGSDAPVDNWDPWLGIHAAVARQRADGSPADGWLPEQRLDRQTALWGYTVGPAIASGELASKGTLTPGKLADVAILNTDLAAVADDQLHTVGVEMTIVDGAVAWERRR